MLNRSHAVAARNRFSLLSRGREGVSMALRAVKGHEIAPGGPRSINSLRRGFTGAVH
jgi:hypothetical protein